MSNGAWGGSEQEVKQPAEIARPAARRKRVFTFMGVAFLALILLVAGVYGWKVFSVRSLEQRIATQRSEMTEARQQALKLQARDMLRLAARPLAWAVRGEMLKGNLGQVDDYLRQFVREPGVKSLVLIGKDGRILLASDRKLETQGAGATVSKAAREATDVVIEESADVVRMAVPVMGFDDRMGILVIDYAPPPAGDASAPGGTAQATPQHP